MKSPKLNPERDPFIWVHPGRVSGTPCIGGRRVPTATVARHYWDLDANEHEVLMAYQITRPQMVLALWYEARFGTRTWRKRLGPWADTYLEELWSGHFDAVPNPSV